MHKRRVRGPFVAGRGVGRLAATVGEHVLVFAHDAVARARCIDEDAVEKVGEVARQHGPYGLGQDAIGDPTALQIAHEGGHALALGFIGQQQAAVVHQGGNLGSLAAWGGAQVEDALAGLGGQDLDSQHGGLGLDVVRAHCMFKGLAETCVALRQGEALAAPRHVLAALVQVGPDVLRLGLERVQAQRSWGGRMRALIKGRALLVVGQQAGRGTGAGPVIYQGRTLCA